MNKNTIRHSLHLALAAAGWAAAGAVGAVNLGVDGRGQVLLYPYYTTRTDGAGNPFGTLVTIINTDAAAKAMRVRFLEGRNSREVLGFNLFLSPNAAWTAAIVPDPATGGARVGTLDPACTLPSLAGSPTAPFVSFSNASYVGPNDDDAGIGFDRTREGFLEVIEMASYPPTSATAVAVTPVDGVPPCDPQLTDARAAAEAGPPSGGLRGAAVFTNVAAVGEFTVEAIALANFYQVGANYHVFGTPLPDLTQAAPPVSMVQTADGSTYESLWTQGTADAVSAVLIHDSVMNDYVLETAKGAGTDWVVTLPTKRYYRAPEANAPNSLFQRSPRDGGGSCDDVALSRRDTGQRGTEPIAPPAGTRSHSLCWATNVFTFRNSNVLGSPSARNLAVPAPSGSVTMRFPTAIRGATNTMHRLINTATSISGGGKPSPSAGSSVAYRGLPTIGFAVQAYGDGRLLISRSTTTAQPAELAEILQRTGRPNVAPPPAPEPVPMAPPAAAPSAPPVAVPNPPPSVPPAATPNPPPLPAPPMSAPHPPPAPVVTAPAPAPAPMGTAPAPPPPVVTVPAPPPAPVVTAPAPPPVPIPSQPPASPPAAPNPPPK